MEQGNQAGGITCVTVEKVTASGKATGYHERKAEGLCTYPGCPSDAADDNTLCPTHRDEKRERDRESQNARRAERRAAGLCPRCGDVETSDYMCPACRVRYGRTARARRGGDSNREGKSRDHLIEADGYQRQRYYGRAKKGAPSLDEQDEFERRIIRASIERYLKASDFLSSAAARELPKDERAAMRLEALSQLSLATRAADDVLDRHRFAEKKLAAQQRSLAQTAAKIAKSGR